MDIAASILCTFVTCWTHTNMTNIKIFPNILPIELLHIILQLNEQDKPDLCLYHCTVGQTPKMTTLFKGIAHCLNV